MSDAHKASYLVGIDLGTTHIVMASQKIDGSGSPEIFPILQLIGPAQHHALPALPALRYHYGAELNARDTLLPWQKESATPVVFGNWARELGARQPNQLLSSAKSWLSCSFASEPHLPIAGDPALLTVTAQQATLSYFDYLISAWQHRYPEAPLADQHLVVTVPASFDDRARQATLDAARHCGLTNVELIEEPMAACYHFMGQSHSADQLRDLDALLVVDLGGGTTDLSLLSVATDESGEPSLERIAVGEHLMLGGDNMDLALAALASQKLGVTPQAGRLDPELVVQARKVKEQLLDDDAPDVATLTLLGRGGSLIKAARSVTLSRGEVQHTLKEGFFPSVAFGAQPKARQSALRSQGLPYPADAAITRHLSAFLSANLGELRQSRTINKVGVLLNGSPFKSCWLREQLSSVVAGWLDCELVLLDNSAPDNAVALGSVDFARRAVLGEDLIRHSSPRNYYLQVQHGFDKQMICCLPKGAKQGEWHSLHHHRFALTLNERAEFNVAYSDALDVVQRDESVADAANSNLHPLPPFRTRLTGNSAEVMVRARYSELGLLELSLQDCNSDNSWPLIFGDEQKKAPLPSGVEEAVATFFARKGQSKQRSHSLRWQLEKLSGARERWDGDRARQIGDQLIKFANRRRGSERREQSWLNMAGFCLRPGVGMVGDEERVEAIWPFWEKGVQYKSAENLKAWYLFWRRVAPGLDEERQCELLDEVGPVLLSSPRLLPVSADEQLRLIGMLERIPPDIKAQLGELLFNWVDDPQLANASLWALGKLGAQRLSYAAQSYCIAQELADSWCKRLLTVDWKVQPLAAKAAAMIVSGSRELRQFDKVVLRLEAGLPQSWVALARGEAHLSVEEIWGESLPAGLTLLQDQAFLAQ